MERGGFRNQFKRRNRNAANPALLIGCLDMVVSNQDFEPLELVRARLPDLYAGFELLHTYLHSDK